MKPQWFAIPLIILLVAVIIGVVAGPLWVTDATLPVRQAITTTIRSVAGFGSWFGDVRKLTQDRDSLAAERNKLLAEVVELEAIKRQDEAIKKQFNIDNTDKKSIIMAHTAGLTQRGNTSFLLINQGSQDGVQAGQVVRSNGVLVGKVKEVSDHVALVQLPISLGSAIPVVIRHGQVTSKGIVEGSFNLTAQLNQVLPTDPISQGDIIVTSADGGLYPPDIVVGKVGQLSAGNNQVFQSATVELLWDIKKLEIVFIER